MFTQKCPSSERGRKLHFAVTSSPRCADVLQIIAKPSVTVTNIFNISHRSCIRKLNALARRSRWPIIRQRFRDDSAWIWPKRRSHNMSSSRHEECASQSWAVPFSYTLYMRTVCPVFETKSSSNSGQWLRSARLPNVLYMCANNRRPICETCTHVHFSRMSQLYKVGASLFEFYISTRNTLDFCAILCEKERLYITVARRVSENKKREWFHQLRKHLDFDKHMCVSTCANICNKKWGIPF